MTPQKLQKELNDLLRRGSGKPRRVMIVGDSIRRIEQFLYYRRLNHRYGVIVRGRRIFIADMRTQNLLNEICLDLATGATTGKAFVYNVVVLGGENGTTPQPLEITKGGSRHGSSYQGQTRQRRSPAHSFIR